MSSPRCVKIPKFLSFLFFKEQKEKKDEVVEEKPKYLTHPLYKKQAVIVLRHYDLEGDDLVKDVCDTVMKSVGEVLLRDLTRIPHEFKVSAGCNIELGGWKITVDTVVVDHYLDGPITHLTIIPDPLGKSEFYYYTTKFNSLNASDMGGGSLEEAYCAATISIVKEIGLSFHRVDRDKQTAWVIKDKRGKGSIDSYVNSIFKPKLSLV